MSKQNHLPYGRWLSSLRPADLATSKRFLDVAWDQDGQTLVWIERNAGRGVIVCQNSKGFHRQVTRHPVGGTIGYGGGDMAVDRGKIYSINAEDGRIYRQPIWSGTAHPITPSFGCSAAPTPSPNGKNLVYINRQGTIDRLVIVDSKGDTLPKIVRQNADFYMQPCWHPKGTHLSWVEWDHPNMPWDGSRLMIARVRKEGNDSIDVEHPEILAGGEDESVFQPAFSKDGKSIIYVSDQLGWSNLWSINLKTRIKICLTPDESDVALPAWVQGLRSFTFGTDGRLYFVRNQSGGRRAFSIEINGRDLRPVDQLANYDHIEQLIASPTGTELACIASSPVVMSRVVVCSQKQVKIYARSNAESLSAANLSRPQPLAWPTYDGTRIHGLLYHPINPSYTSDGLPPLVINIHSGPTTQTWMSFEERAQFFATRGWAFLDVNYRGSTGHGRGYMRKLYGSWGLFDVEDTISAVEYMKKEGRIDHDRIVVCGSSAGGYTVLRTLTLYPGLFKAALCIYGISNLFTLSQDTHKFESHYLDSLIGKLPEASSIYRERSPIFSSDMIVDPVAIFQGSKDRVVPQNQAEEIIEVLRKRGVPHAYHLYEGEGHGWRNPEIIEQFYKDIDKFLLKHVLL